MAKQLGFHFDATACTGCKACQIACKDKNDLPVGVSWRHALQYGGGSWVAHPSRPDLMVSNNIFVYSISKACMHCASPICMEVCPAGAITKRADGIVTINTEQCIGCRYCEWACPYGAPQYNEQLRAMTKCTMCQDLVDQGQNPACVDACPMRALHFGDMEELRAKYGNLAAIEPLPEAHLTQPSLVITPHKHAQASGKGTGKILDPEEM